MARRPGYNLHKPSGQARTQINGVEHWLGKHNSHESRRRYRELIEQWKADRKDQSVGLRPDITVGDLVQRYRAFAHDHYRKNGRQTSEVSALESVLRVIEKSHSKTYAADFGPKALIQVRDKMIALGWKRISVNKQAGRIRRMFKWAASEELLSSSVYHDLMTVQGLESGRSCAVESTPVTPVPVDTLTAILPHLRPPVAAMVQLQLLTAMRPGEVLHMRAEEVDCWGDVWEYRPGSHKTEHHGKTRVIFIGPKAQKIIEPFLNATETGYVFRPTMRNNKLPANRPYGRDSYRNAIKRACEKAEVDDFHPHRIRHTAATALRQQGDVETSKIILGHATIAMTEVYAERDHSKARDVMKQLG
ncbi:Tyrosine recombinase XerC [Symmachiella macrocystis]|uniref:Tyrosine recombinase XerC n=1 Tax=Symmachiella macrocystis TaxID=2527985 RepID=A0A5C6B984_9PLAN|nr:site-specific integrase [Symmachiella macrocystis]TWU08835.1 Tyrosine recombinase XerC [Symmachiella macrocystis]